MLPSRAEALSGIAAALDACRGPVLLTGEPGVGKTWVCRRLRDAMPASWRWAAVDLSPAMVEREFLRLVLHSLGLDRPGGTAKLRPAIADILADASVNGERWGLIVDEAQNGSVGVLEELRVLGNHLGERGAFAGMVMVGQSALARRLMTRPLAGLEARISARFHLRPLDVEELRTWLARLDPRQSWDSALVERVHRQTAGNPARTQLWTGWRPVAPAIVEPATVPAPSKRATVEPLAVEHAAAFDAPPVGPGKPPIRVGDGMIEVGWEPTDGSGPEFDDEPAPDRTTPAPVSRPAVGRDLRAPSNADGHEPGGPESIVEDHYAALQAWTEWAQNQGRQLVGAVPPHDARQPAKGLATDPLLGLDPDEDPAARLPGRPGVRAEGQQEFAPYSQLFSRLHPSRDSQ